MSREINKNIMFEEFVNAGGKIIADNKTISEIIAHEPMAFVAILEFHTELGKVLFPNVTREEVEELSAEAKKESGYSDEKLEEVESKAKLLFLLSDLLSI